MFTGIIREIGFLKRKRKKAQSIIVLQILSKKIKPKLGESVSVNGVCLTVKKKIAGGFEVEVIPETLRRSTFTILQEDSKLNLEPSMKAGEKFDGHLLLGHVDGFGKVLKKGMRDYGFTLECPNHLMRFIVEKGSIAINGVSLTVAKVQGKRVTVALITFTRKNTNLGNVKVGDFLNIEVDIIARYIEEILKKRKISSVVSPK